MLGHVVRRIGGGPRALPAVVSFLLAATLAPIGGSAAEPVAAAPGGATVAIEELIQAAVEANPSIRAARAEVDAVKARTRVATTYADPLFTATWWPENASEGKQASWELMLEQGIPFPGKLGAVGRLRDAEESATGIALQRVIREVTLKVRESATELVYLRTAGKIAAGNRELLGRLRAAGETGYAAGRAGLYDALRAQSQQSQTVFDERLLAELEATEAARLNSLLSRSPETPVGPIELHAGRPIVVTPAEIAAGAGSDRQEVRLARTEATRAREERHVADFEALPELMLGVGYIQESALDAMEEASQWKFELGFTLPLHFGRNAGRRDEATAGEARALAMEREAGDLARAEVSENWFRLRNAERLVELYRDALLPQAAASMQLAETWYRAGQGSFADLVDAGTLWYSFQLAVARAAADREKYLARLEALAERPLTGAPGGTGSAAGPAADETAWREALERIEGERAALEAEAASPHTGLEVLVPDPKRALELAPAAGDDAVAAAALLPRVALGDVELLALLRSPLVRAAERSFRAALEQYGQVSALDEVVRRYASATGSLMSGVGGAMGAGSAASFPFPGMLALKGQVVTQDALAARAELGRARRDALAEARRLYWSLAFAHRGAELLGEILGLQEQTVQAVRASYESGQGALADLTQAQVELEKARTERENVVAERGVLEAQLRALLALPREAALGRPLGTEVAPAAGDAGALAAVALERRQELRRMRAMAARMELMLQMAEREITPGFALGASLLENQPLLQDGTMAMREPFETVAPAAVGTGTPLRAFAGRTAGYVRETRERLAALREEIRAEEQATVARVREAWFAFDRAAREERLWSLKVGELTRLASETQDRAYRAGRATLPEALGAAVTARASALEAERRRARLGEAWAELEAAVGGPLPRPPEGT
jgi:outer membrane protein TolC